MKSTAGGSYATPSEYYVKNYIHEASKSKKGLAKDLGSIIKDENGFTNIRHLANKLSGGTVDFEDIGEIEDHQFINGFDKLDLLSSDSHSYLDYATYAYLRKNENERQSGGSGDDAGKVQKGIEEDMKEFSKSLNIGDNSGNRSDNDVSGLEDLLQLHDSTLGDITWNVARVMSQLVPHAGLDVTNLYEDPDGSERLIRKMKDLSEIALIKASDMSLPEDIYLAGLAEESFIVNKHAMGTIKKQFVYLMVDCSGSMAARCNVGRFKEWTRIQVAREICNHFLERVKDGSAVVYFKSFACYPDPVFKADTLGSVGKAEKHLNTYVKDRGDNNFEDTFKEAFIDMGEIQKSDFFPPELIMLTDGGGEMGISKIPMVGFLTTLT